MPFVDQLSEPRVGAASDAVDEAGESLTDSLLGPIPDDDLETTFLEEAKPDVLEEDNSNLESDIAAAEKKGQAFTAKLASYKEKLHARPVLYHTYRVVLATIGGIVLLGGIIMLATPGPGWLAIFLGLGILATEFSWAHRLNVWAKAKVRGIVAAAKERVAQRKASKEGPFEQEPSQETSSH